MRLRRQHPGLDRPQGGGGAFRPEPGLAPIELLAAQRSFAGRNRMWRDLAQHLMCLTPLLGVLQNDTAPMIIDDPPFFDLLERSKAAEADKVIV
jgi:hypothetical protein